MSGTLKSALGLPLRNAAPTPRHVGRAQQKNPPRSIGGLCRGNCCDAI
ncbi:hypothetical protein [Azospirillum argentinense]